MNINQLDTPAAIVELDKLEANITRLQKYLDNHGIANRPHIKTHKIPEIAPMQIKAGAVGITCQKIGEAEVMAQAGIKDIFLPYNINSDRKILSSGAMTLEDCAFKVITTIVSRPTTDRGILDGGSKTFSSDRLGLEGLGLILEYPEAAIYDQSEEHGHVDFSKCTHKPDIGERVTVIPNHCCVVSNLFNQVVGVRNGQVEVIWPVAARGALQ